MISLGLTLNFNKQKLEDSSSSLVKLDIANVLNFSLLANCMVNIMVLFINR